MPALAKKLRLSPRNDLAEVYWLPWAKRFACAIRITGSTYCGSRALYAAACRQIPITSPITQPRALGRRVSDEFTVPVCRAHHRELHRAGNEVAWWHRLNIDPLPVALKLRQQSRADGELFPSPEGVRQTSATNTPDVIAHDRSGPAGPRVWCGADNGSTAGQPQYTN
jgi:hypothetical protein